MKRYKNKISFERATSGDDVWKGPVYFNRKDPRLIVPKINPMMGWTLNFGNRKAYLLLIGLILLIALTYIFLK